MPIKNFGKITRNYIGQPFDKYNCLQLIYCIYEDMGIELDTFKEDYKGHNVDDYMSYWKEHPKQAVIDMIEVLKKVGKEVDPKFPTRGDITVIEYKGSKFPAIYTGNGCVIASSEERGIIMIPVGQMFKITMIRRVF